MTHASCLSLFSCFCLLFKKHELFPVLSERSRQVFITDIPSVILQHYLRRTWRIVDRGISGITTSNCPYRLIFTEHDNHLLLTGKDHFFDGNLSKFPPLARRAWTYQERLLSRRVVHFGKGGLQFECVELQRIVEQMGINADRKCTVLSTQLRIARAHDGQWGKSVLQSSP